MKLLIESLSSKEIATRKGPARVLRFQSAGLWYSFAGSWNAHRQNGLEIESADDQIKRSEKDGGTYLNIQAPAKANRAAQGADNEKLDRILRGVETLWREIQEVKAALNLKQPQRPGGGRHAETAENFDEDCLVL
jgi:hypothetical protein